MRSHAQEYQRRLEKYGREGLRQQWRDSYARSTSRKAQRGRYVEKRRQFIRKEKSRPCVDCGVQYPHYVMQFDHVPGRGEKLFNVNARKYAWSLKKLKEEIAKCEVVCANCHAERTWRRLLNAGAVV